MKKKVYIEIKAWGSLASALAILAILILFEAVDTFGLVIGLAVLVWCSYESWKYFKQLKNITDEETVFTPPADATVDQQITYFKRWLWIGLAGLAILTFFTWYDLNEVVEGTRNSSSLILIPALIYPDYGYWPALLSLPFCGVLMSLLVWLRIRKIKNAKIDNR